MLLAALILSPVRGVTAQRDPQKLQQLDAARAALRNTPNDVRLQKRYLDTFPDTYKSFMDLFENFDGFDYIDVLPSLAKNYDVQVGELLVRLGKDAHYEADFTVFGYIIIQLRLTNPNLDEWRLGWGHTSRKQTLYEGSFPARFWP